MRKKKRRRHETEYGVISLLSKRVMLLVISFLHSGSITISPTYLIKVVEMRDSYFSDYLKESH
jgi:hypothetical protein